MVHPRRGTSGSRFVLTKSATTPTTSTRSNRDDMAIAMFHARGVVTLAYERHECDIDAAMNDAGEAILAHPTECSEVVALRVWQERNHAPLVHDSSRASLQVISIT